jgi:hypothetical protein
MAELLTNFGRTTITGSITDSATSVIVTDGSVFPATGDFRLNCEDELMLCTARSSNTLTVERGIEGTTAVSHDSGRTITQVATAASVQRLIDERTVATKLFTYERFR